MYWPDRRCVAGAHLVHGAQGGRLAPPLCVHLCIPPSLYAMSPTALFRPPQLTPPKIARCARPPTARTGAIALFVFIPLWLCAVSIYCISLANPKPRSGGLAAFPNAEPFNPLTWIGSSAAFATAFYVFAPGGQLKLLSLLLLGAASARARVQLTSCGRFDPRFRALDAGAAGGLFCAALALVVRVHHADADAPADTVALAIAAPLGAALFAAASAYLHFKDVRVATGILKGTQQAESEGKGVTAAAVHAGATFTSAKQARDAGFWDTAGHARDRTKSSHRRRSHVHPPLLPQVQRIAAVLSRLGHTESQCPPHATFAVEVVFLCGEAQRPPSASCLSLPTSAFVPPLRSL